MFALATGLPHVVSSLAVRAVSLRSISVAPMQLSQEQILRLVERLDIPECGCKVEFVDCGCQRHEKEYEDLLKELRQEKARALAADDYKLALVIEKHIEGALIAAKWWSWHHQVDCTPPLRWPPCEHVIEHFERWPKGFSYADYVELVKQLDPGLFNRDQEWRIEHSYTNPPAPPPANILALQRETRIALYADRLAKGYHLYGQHDFIDPSRLPSTRNGEVGLQGGNRYANGEDRDLGLGTKRTP